MKLGYWVRDVFLTLGGRLYVQSFMVVNQIQQFPVFPTPTTRADTTTTTNKQNPPTKTHNNNNNNNCYNFSIAAGELTQFQEREISKFVASKFMDLLEIF